MYNENRNKTWNDNHAKIEEAFWRLYADTENIPKIKDLVTATGISPKTIYEHYQEMSTEEITEKYKVHLDRAMGALSKKAEDGDVYAIQLLAKLTGWIEKKNQTLEVKNKTLDVKFTD